MPKGGTSPIAQEDQPTYQGLLNDNSEFTAILRKVVGKTVHATIPKGNIWDIWSIHCSWQCSCLKYFCCFPLVLTNLRLCSCVILSNFIEELVIQYYPQYLSALLRALFRTTFLEIAVCLCYNLRCVYHATDFQSIGPFIQGTIRRALNKTRTVPFIRARLS